MCVGYPAIKASQQQPITVPKVQLQAKQQTLPPGWRSATSARSSDREIHVIESESGKTNVYNVHDAFIARGVRKSAYFENLSDCTDQFQESSTNSRIIPVRLDEKAAAAFPVFLDYTYGNPYFRLTVDNVLAVRRLADLFKNIPLLSETWRFIKANMQVNNYEQYLRDAQRFGDKQTASWVAFGCAQNIDKIDPSSDIWRMMSQTDFRRLASLLHLCRIGHSMHCSEIVAAYLGHHINEMDETAFKEITNSSVLPEISLKAAMILMKAEYHVRRTALEEKARQKVLSSLQRRCMNTLNANKQGNS
mmetsp:Transcript_18889/g.29291  ORF Transcript_18889/g.29291 Transcript_18889/m.29291 type:complete len:305 (+) Transcript_18889:44-958(+)